jgi:glutamate--cysteine ligase
MTTDIQAANCADGVLSHAAAEAWIPRTCFKHGPPGRIGLELELILTAAMHGPELGAPDLVGARAALTAAAVHGRVTVEPGGQIELSTDPSDDLTTVLSAAAADVTVLRQIAARHRTGLLGIGLDPTRRPQRLLRHPRYDAMEAFFDASGPAGRAMMCSTASVQVNVEATAGDPLHGPDHRWRMLHAVGPTLVAAFANSPLHRGRPTGWRSTRQAIWLALDPYRTHEPVIAADETLETAWTRWCLDAPVMLVRRSCGSWSAPPGLTFRQWITEGSRAVPDRPGPTTDDLAHHLTTLFPPVRARGHLEVRYVDAQPGDWWQAPAGVLAALTEDERAADAALDACAAVRGRWRDAARAGLGDRELAAAARGVLEAAAAALRRDPRARPSAEAVEEYAERWTLRHRSPADDVLERRPVPPAPTPNDVRPAAAMEGATC